MTPSSRSSASSWPRPRPTVPITWASSAATARAETANRSDVTMLARIDPDKGVVDLISVPRDTMIDIEGHGTQKINAAYAFGGPSKP